MTRTFKDDFIEEIRKAGFPVIAFFDHMDSTAMIYAKSENEVVLNDYGEYYLCLRPGPGHQIALQDLSEKGLYILMREGVRPGEKYWEEHLESATYETEEEEQ